MMILSKNIYQCPFPSKTKILGIIEKVAGSHIGPWRGAIDFLVPLGTPVVAAQNGTVIAVVDTNKKFGKTQKYAQYYNYIQLQHKNGEYSEYGHLALNSGRIKVGDKVKQGKILAHTGQSGWMTQPHLHFLVFNFLPENKPYRFKGESYYFIGLKPKLI